MLRKFQKNLENTGIFNWRWFTEVFQGLCKHHKERCGIFLRVLVHFFRAPVTASTQQGAKYNSSLRIFITLPLPKNPNKTKQKQHYLRSSWSDCGKFWETLDLRVR